MLAERGITPTTRSELAVHADASADDGGIAAEPPLPEQLADERRRLGIGALVVRREQAAERGGDAEFGEVVGGGERQVDLAPDRAGPRQPRRRPPDCAPRRR